MYMICPYCGGTMECDEVDVGVGVQQSGPYGCSNCHAVQVRWEDRNAPELDEEEKKFQVWKGRNPDPKEYI
jgi:hypothetical protein